MWLLDRARKTLEGLVCQRRTNESYSASTEVETTNTEAIIEPEIEDLTRPSFWASCLTHGVQISLMVQQVLINKRKSIIVGTFCVQYSKS